MTDLTRNIGRYATLNSGGPLMLITGVTPSQQYVCSWDNEGIRQTREFLPVTVRVQNPADETNSATSDEFITRNYAADATNSLLDLSASTFDTPSYDPPSTPDSTPDTSSFDFGGGGGFSGGGGGDSF